VTERRRHLGARSASVIGAEEAKRWSQRVTRESYALDLEPGVFTWDDPREIALSLKLSAEASTRRRARPFQSAMSMLNFYINRAGKTLPDQRRKTLDQAKTELRKLFRRELVGRFI